MVSYLGTTTTECVSLIASAGCLRSRLEIIGSHPQDTSPRHLGTGIETHITNHIRQSRLILPAGLEVLLPHCPRAVCTASLLVVTLGAVARPGEIQDETIIVTETVTATDGHSVVGVGIGREIGREIRETIEEEETESAEVDMMMRMDGQNPIDIIDPGAARHPLVELMTSVHGPAETMTQTATGVDGRKMTTTVVMLNHGHTVMCPPNRRMAQRLLQDLNLQFLPLGQ